MAEPIDLSSTFIHLEYGGSATPIELTPRFWGQSVAGNTYDRLVGCVDFSSPKDLHSSAQEMHPEADEVIFVVSGAIDVVLQEAAGEQTTSLVAGHAAIVPRGVWHSLVMRRPGRLLFINCRTGMKSTSD